MKIVKSVCDSFYKYLTGSDDLYRALNPLPKIYGFKTPQVDRIGSMGLGHLGQEQVTFRHRMRWTYSEVDEEGNVTLPEQFVKINARPALNIQQTAFTSIGGMKTWISGRAEWESITLNYYEPTDAAMDYYHDEGFRGRERKGILRLYSNGQVLEEWELDQAWAESVVVGALDYADPNRDDLEVRLRYSEAKYNNRMGSQ